MKVLDVNVLVYAFRPDIAEHTIVKAWLEALLQSSRPFGVPDIAFSGFVRIVTRKPFDPASSPSDAWGFVEALRKHAMCTTLYGSPQHFADFRALCERIGAMGNLLTDAYVAAFALIADGEVVSCDDDFASFPGLSWRSPLNDQLRTNPR